MSVPVCATCGRTIAYSHPGSTKLSHHRVRPEKYAPWCKGKTAVGQAVTAAVKRVVDSKTAPIDVRVHIEDPRVADLEAKVDRLQRALDRVLRGFREGAAEA